LRHVPQPGVGLGVFTEEHNVVAYWNRIYLQRFHLNGLVSVIPTSALVLIGTALGDVLRQERWRPLRRMAMLVAAGLGLLAAGWLVHLDLPFNKPAWTASYILWTAGWASVTLGVFYGLLDVGGWRAWAFPFLVFGSNAIFAYVAPILTKIYVLQGWVWPAPPVVGQKPLSLQEGLLHTCVVHWGRLDGGMLYTAGYVLVWWLALFMLYRKRIFLRV
jgi:predicted acyltransferase